MDPAVAILFLVLLLLWVAVAVHTQVVQLVEMD
jgi:hypothetical protein